MEPARRYIQQYMVPEGVLVLKVDSRECLPVVDEEHEVKISGKTDFLLVEESVARQILDANLRPQNEPSDGDISSLLQLALLGMLELKTPRLTQGECSSSILG